MGTWTRCQEYLEILKENTGKDEEEFEWLVERKIMWMRETRIRIFMQMELKACRDELDWLARCYLCAVNNCREEYGPPMYVCMVITYSRVWINRVRLPILLVVS